MHYKIILLLLYFIISISTLTILKTHAQSYDSTDTETSQLASPEDLAVIRLNDTSVVIKWDIPLTNERLLYFKIQYKANKPPNAPWHTESKEIPPNSKACQINGLRPGTYFFIVAAVYDNDDNRPSYQFRYKLRPKSKIKAEEWPNMTAPDIFWSESKSDYFRFKWRYTPRDADMEYFGYLVYYRSAYSVSDFYIHNSLDESCEIAEVEQDTPYEAKVIAYNNFTVSEMSQLVTIRTQPNSTTNYSILTHTTTERPKSPIITSSTELYLPPSSSPVTVATSTTPIPAFPFSTTPPPTTTTTATKRPFIVSFREWSDLSNPLVVFIYGLLLLLLIIFTLVFIIFQRPKSRPKPVTITHNTMFEIDFKNSFPDSRII